MKSKRLQLALLKLSEAKKGESLSDGFEVMNLDEASATRGGNFQCTCDAGGNYSTTPPCTCRGGDSNYTARLI